MKINVIRIFFLLLVHLLALSACARVPYQTYEGPALEKSQVSILKNTYRLAPTAGDRIKVTKIDNKELPGAYGSFEILAGKHFVQACYSQEYTCGTVRDAWGGNCCSIYGYFNIEYDFTPGDQFEFEIRQVKKYFAFQEIQVLLKNLTTGNLQILEQRGVDLALDCYKDEPDLSEFIGGRCF